MSFWWVILIILGFAIIGGIIQANSNSKREKNKKDKFNDLLNNDFTFQPTQKIIGVKSNYLFAIDDNSKRIIYISSSLIKKNLNYIDIVSVEILENNNVVSKKSTVRTVGGALIGGAIAGGVGSIIGGLSGSSKEKKMVSSVNVKILTTDINTTIIIPCFNASSMTTEHKHEIAVDSMDGYLYKDGLSHANQIKDAISVIIDQTDKNNQDSQSNNKQNLLQGDVLEQLEKLHNLKERGIITEEEFKDQKTRLLNQTAIPKQKSISDLDIQILDLVNSDNIIQAVKLCCDEKGYSLAEAKKYVDDVIKNNK